MRILIVEDDRDLAAALDDALRFEGYATRVAYNGLEAVCMPVSYTHLTLPTTPYV